MDDLLTFVNMVRTMREKQKQYFKTRDQNAMKARSKKIDKVLREFLNKNGWNGTTVDAIRLMQGYVVTFGAKGKVTIERKA